MDRLILALWEHREMLCGGKGAKRETAVMGRILEAHFGPFTGSQPLQLQRLVIENLNAMTILDLALLQKIVPFLYKSSYSIKAWFVPVSKATQNKRKKNYLRIADDTQHRATVQRRLQHKNRHRVDVHVGQYLKALDEWKEGPLEAKMCAFLAAVGCRRSEMLDPFIIFEFAPSYPIVTQLGVHKSKHCVTLRKRCLLPNLAQLLSEIRAEKMGVDKTRKEIGDLPIWKKCCTLVRKVIPGGTCHTLRAVYIALTFDNRSSFTSHAQRCCGHSSLDTALHYQGIALI